MKILKKTASFAVALALLLGVTPGVARIAASADTDIYNQYIGMIHEHTQESDGMGTTDEAYTTARDDLGYDFFALTDHSHFFSDYANFTERELDVAAKYNEDGKFITLPGFEMTWDAGCGWWGHMNTYDTGWIQTLRSIDEPLDYYYGKLKSSPDAFAQFNHPGYEWGDFDDFNYYDPEIDKVVCLIEVKPQYEASYIRALDTGWHVSPTYQDDNHTATWGQNGAATVILAKNLTHADLVEAIRANRTYATRDRNLRLDFTGNGAVMGSRLSGIDSLKLNVKADYSTGTVSKISIISNGGQMAAEKTVDASTADWSIDVPVGDSLYYYARLTASNGKYAYSAPIWVENGNGLAISNTDVGENKADPAHPYEIKFDLKNTTGDTLSNISVELTRAGVSDGETWTLPMLAVGATKEIRVPAAYQEASRDVNIVVKCTDEDATIGDSAGVNLPELLMTEFLASTFSENSIFNAYKFIEVYNASSVAKNLADYKLKYHTHYGRLDEMTTFDISEKVTVPAYGTAVIWLKDESNPEIIALSKNDFCKFYHNSVKASAVAAVTYRDGGDPAESQNGHDFYLMTDGGTTLDYIRYNHGLQVAQNVYVNSSVKYTYSKDGGYLNVLLEDSESVTPGSVTAAQVPYAAKGTSLKEADASTRYVNLAAGGDKAIFTVENAALTALSSSSEGTVLSVETPLGGMTFTPASAKGLASSGADIAFTLAKAGENKLTVSAKAGETELSAFDPPLLLSVGYTGNAKANELSASDGNDRILPQSVFSPESGSVLVKIGAPGTYGITSASVSFTDTEGNWAEDSISFLAVRGIVGGSGGRFNSSSQITRAEFVKILAQTAGANVSVYKESAFADVSSSDWFAPYVAWAAEKGVVTGMGAGLFEPNGKVTRQDMAVMLSRLAKIVMGYSLTSGDHIPFSDDAKISGYAKNSVYAMKAVGILTGKANNAFDPLGAATRAEAAKMITMLIHTVVLG